MATSRLAGVPATTEAESKRLKMSYEQYLSWSDGPAYTEWKDGEVIISMPIKDAHQRVVEMLYLVMGFFVRLRGLGLLRLMPFEVRLGPHGPSREPDLFFAANEHLDRLSNDRFVGGPDLVIEVVSDDSVTRDNREKFEEYREAGVREYWIIDPRPRRHTAKFYRLDSAGRYVLVGPDAEGIVRSEVLPGFWWRMSWLWDDPAPLPDKVLAEILGQPER